MADKPADKTTKKRRIVRDPETFRERAVKAAEQNGKPAKKHRLKRASKAIASPVTKPAGKLSNKLSDKQPFKLFAKVGRVIGKILVPKYFRESWAELRQVTWLNWKQSRSLTIAVLIFAIIFGLIVAGVDWVLDRLFRDILLK